ncbi:MAG: hypothetical protein JO306_02145, partial [Gemmatimonadetes bacterium]|nr:hypothetical protein [Gemmatimonadota bacterium]
HPDVYLAAGADAAWTGGGTDDAGRPPSPLPPRGAEVSRPVARRNIA